MYIKKAAFVADNYGVTVSTYVDVVQRIIPLRILHENHKRLLICTVCVGGINASPNIVSSHKKQLTSYELFDMMQRLYTTVSYYVI